MSRARYGLTSPCSNCPFRSDVPPYLRKARVTEIERSLEQSEFLCHKTVQHHEDEHGEVWDADTSQSAHCAGALILLEKLGRPSQMMRIAERLGMYDASKLDMSAPVYPSFSAMRKAQRR
jgi:hypothetical protein